MPYLLLLINVLVMTGGQLLFKQSAVYMNSSNLGILMKYLTNPWFYGAVSLYVVSTFVWTQALTKVPLSVAYPIISLTYILTIAGAYFFFHEKISLVGFVGIIFIVLGVSITALR